MDLQAWTWGGFLLSRTTIWAKLGAFWDIFEVAIEWNSTEICWKNGLTFFNGNFEGVNAGHGRCMIPLWKAALISLHVMYPEPAISRVQRSYRASKSCHLFFQGISRPISPSSCSKSASKWVIYSSNDSPWKYEATKTSRMQIRQPWLELGSF